MIFPESKLFYVLSIVLGCVVIFILQLTSWWQWILCILVVTFLLYIIYLSFIFIIAYMLVKYLKNNKINLFRKIVKAKLLFSNIRLISR